MTTYLEISAVQVLPPSNVNRDDTGAPKSATYGGVLRSRVSSQSWKRAMRKDFNNQVDPSMVGRRTKQVVQLIMDSLIERAPETTERAEELVTAALGAAKIKVAKPKAKKDQEPGIAEMGYLMFISQQQIDAVVSVIAEAVQDGKADDDKAFAAAMKDAQIGKLLDSQHSIDIALFGRMVAEAPDLNVDASCQVAHALGVHAMTPEFDYFTAVDDSVEAKEETGAGMIGTVEFASSTLYRYAALNLDQLAKNLEEPTAQKMAVEQFVRSFVNAVPSGKQNTFAHGTRPSAVLVTIAQGQPTSLVGAFEEPVADGQGHLAKAVAKLSAHAKEVFETWRKPDSVLVCGLPSQLGKLAELGEGVSFDQLIERVGESAVQA